ncbi:helix-turn-helix transcriptional regulator [Actinomadura gamaensis]|uniref:Helix-turn-helix transcriptional regulator n=1 Tax=Actinomadura gamaensis TaxID=1763541 RepID=A0ABV9TT97_9ACTN
MEDIEAVAALRDPVRRRLYEYVAAQGREVGRDEAAEAAGVQRTLAAFHLDKLVAVGLLEVGTRRLTGRAGPGAGRPAKVYRPVAAELVVSVPPRDYPTAAGVLAEAAEAAGLDDEVRTAARRAGRAVQIPEPRDVPAVREALERRGYAPSAGEDGVVRLMNCPFHVLAERFPPLVCGMNLALLEGVLEGVDGLRARMDARPGRCCVVLEPSKTNNH